MISSKRRSFTLAPARGVMPGVRDLLSELATRQEICCALLTGNFARSARIKALFMTVWCPDSRSVESNCGIPRG